MGGQCLDRTEWRAEEEKKGFNEKPQCNTPPTLGRAALACTAGRSLMAQGVAGGPAPHALSTHRKDFIQRLLLKLAECHSP